METKQLVRATATIVKIISLKKGDIVKVVNKDYGNNYKMSYAIITDVLHSGEEAFINATVYNKSHYNITVDFEVWGKESKKLSLFPATAEDLKGDYQQVIDALIKKNKEEKQEIAKRESQITELENLRKGNLKLTTPEFQIIEMDDNTIANK